MDEAEQGWACSLDASRHRAMAREVSWLSTVCHRALLALQLLHGGRLAVAGSTALHHAAGDIMRRP